MAAETGPSAEDLRRRFVSLLSPKFGVPDTGARAGDDVELFSEATLARVFTGIDVNIVIGALLLAYGQQTRDDIAQAISPRDEPTGARPPTAVDVDLLGIARAFYDQIDGFGASIDAAEWEITVDSIKPDAWTSFPAFVRATIKLHGLLLPFLHVTSSGEPYRESLAEKFRVALLRIQQFLEG